MTVEQEEQIKKLMNEIECPFDFNCYKTGFTNLHKILQDMPALEHLVLTSEQSPLPGCIYSYLCGDTYFCKCPLALYVIKQKIEI